jgi:hypothetical protein
MRRRIIQCDVCGRDMTKDNHQYRFKQRDIRCTYDWDGTYIPRRVWNKLDMCETCYEDLKSFILGNNQLRKDGQSPVVVN